MITSVYLSNNVIQIVQGERSKKMPVLKKVIREEIPEGSLINGIITNEQDLQEQLGIIWERHQLPTRNVELVLNSTKISSKSVTVMKQSDRKIQRLLPLEFQDVERVDEVIYDYSLLGSKGQGLIEIMAVMADEASVQGFADVFKQIGVTLQRITFARACISDFLNTVPALAKGLNTLLLVDGNALSSILWLDGKMVYMDKKRLFDEPGTPGFALEAAKSISKIVNLQNSRKADQKIQQVYTCGFSTADITQCGQYLVEFELPYPVQELPDVQPEAVFAGGNLVINSRSINLLRFLGKKRKEETSLRAFVKTALPVLVLLAVCVVAGVIINGRNVLLQHQLDELNEYILNPAYQKAAADYDAIDDQKKQLQSSLNKVDKVTAAIDSYPLPNSQVKDTIMEQSGADVTASFSSYDADTGELKISVSATTAETINAYISRLDDTGLFREIQYPGYNYQKEADNYKFDVSCYLASNAGR